MNQDSQQNILSTSQALADRGEYEQALSCLNTMECVMASWMKGKIYLSVAEQLSKDFIFTFYRTTEMKLKYQELLTQAYDHLCKAAEQLPSASYEIRENLNKCLWHQIAKVEHEIIVARAVDEEAKFEAYEDDNSYIEVWTENLVDDISDWKLEMNDAIN